jgi:hypothetical protein
MQMLGQKVATERDQQADQDLRAGLLAEMLRYPILRDGRNPGDAYTYGDAADRKPSAFVSGSFSGAAKSIPMRRIRSACCACATTGKAATADVIRHLEA